MALAWAKHLKASKKTVSSLLFTTTFFIRNDNGTQAKLTDKAVFKGVRLVFLSFYLLFFFLYLFGRNFFLLLLLWAYFPEKYPACYGVFPQFFTRRAGF